MISLTAHDIAADPDLYEEVIRFGPNGKAWECMGYSNTYRRVKFGRIVRDTKAPAGSWGLRTITRYVDPETPVEIVPDEDRTNVVEEV